VQQDVASRVLEQVQEQPRQRGLATAALSYYCECLAGVNAEGNVVYCVQRLCAVPEDTREPSRFEEWHGSLSGH